MTLTQFYCLCCGCRPFTWHTSLASSTWLARGPSMYAQLSISSSRHKLAREIHVSCKTCKTLDQLLVYTHWYVRKTSFYARCVHPSISCIFMQTKFHLQMCTSVFVNMICNAQNRIIILYPIKDIRLAFYVFIYWARLRQIFYKNLFIYYILIFFGLSLLIYVNGRINSIGESVIISFLWLVHDYYIWLYVDK